MFQTTAVTQNRTDFTTLSAKTSKHNIILDLLRIMATTEIFLMHLTLYVPLNDEFKTLNFLVKFSSRGGNAVSVLFCLSGYLIYKELAEKNIPTAVFYKKRLKRIVPVYYFVLILYICAGLLPLNLNILRYFLFVNGLIPSVNYELYNNMGGFWSMGCFLLWYLAAPWLQKHIKNLKQSLIALFSTFLFGQLIKIILNYIYIYVNADEISYMLGNNPFSNLYFFCFGITVYYLLKEEKIQEGYFAFLLLILFLTILNSPWYLFWASLSAMFLILSGKIELKLPRRIGNLITYFSKISFCFYLTHLGCITFIHGLWNDDLYPSWMYAVLTTTVTFLLSVFVDLTDRYILQRLCTKKTTGR